MNKNFVIFTYTKYTSMFIKKTVIRLTHTKKAWGSVVVKALRY